MLSIVFGTRRERFAWSLGLSFILLTIYARKCYIVLCVHRVRCVLLSVWLLWLSVNPRVTESLEVTPESPVNLISWPFIKWCCTLSGLEKPSPNTIPIGGRRHSGPKFSVSFTLGCVYYERNWNVFNGAKYINVLLWQSNLVCMHIQVHSVTEKVPFDI